MKSGDKVTFSIYQDNDFGNSNLPIATLQNVETFLKIEKVK